MTILWLIVFALLVGLLIYRLFYTLIRSVRVVIACLAMTVFIAVVQNTETIGHLWNPTAWHFPFVSEKRLTKSNERPAPVTDIAFQSIIRADQNFLDEFMRTQSQTGQSPRIPTSLPAVGNELADNTLRVKRAELVPHKETVKRAELVTQNEASKHTGLVRSGQR
jgi:hypothetical protein